MDQKKKDKIVKIVGQVNGLIFVTLLMLKCTYIINISWWCVFAPLIIPAVLFVGGIAFSAYWATKLK
jgi:hypothetical protein